MTPAEAVRFAIVQLQRKTLRDDDYEEAQDALDELRQIEARVQCWDSLGAAT